MSVVDVIGHYQRSIEKCSGDPERLLHCMGKLHGLPISVQHLQTTGVGRTVNSLRKYQGAVGEAAKALVLKWKQMVAAEGTSEEEEEEAAPEEDAEDDAEEGDEKDEDEREVEREREGPVENGGSEEEDEEEEDEEVEEDGSKNKERAETEEEIDDEDEEEEEANERNRQVNVRSRTADDEVESKEKLARREERSNHYHHHHRHKSSHLDKNDGRLKSSDGDHLESKRSDVSSLEKSGHHRPDRSKSREEKDGSRDKSVEKARHHEHGRSETKEERERRKEKERRKKEGHSEGKEREKKERRDADGHRNKDKRRESREGREGEKERDKHKEMKRQKHEEEMRRQKQEEEERRQEEEEKREEEERQEEERRRQKEAARKRHKEEEERRQRKEEDKRKQKEEERRRHKDEEKRRQKQEEERRKQEEEEKRRQEEEKREEEKQNEAEKQRQLEKERRAEKERGREEKKSKDKGGKRKEDRMNGKAEVEKSKCDSTHGKDKDRSKGESSKVSSSEGHLKRDQMSSNLKEEKVGNQAPEDGGVKLKKKRKVLELADGSIDCGSGASFAEALGMVEPLRSRGAPSSPSKLKKRKKEPSSSKAPLPDSTTSSTSRSTGKSVSKPSIAEMAGDGEFSLLSPSAAMRLEPLEVDIAATLPQTVPHYRPLPHPRLDYSPTRGNHHKGMISEEEALSAIMNTKNQRTKVYSGVRSSFTYVPTLYELCIRLLQENIDALGQTGGVPFDLLKPVLERATPQQLLFLEDENPYLVEDTDAIWGFHCQKDFRTRQRQEMETWREMYLRCSDEREAKLKVLTANIQRSMVQSQLPVRRTKLAYVDTVAKPPRNIARTQAKYGTSRVPLKPMIKAVSSGVVSGASSSSQLVVNTPSSSIASAVGATSPISLSSAAASARIGVIASSPNKKPRVAPLMQKTLKFIKGRYKR